MDCKDCTENMLEEQIKMIGNEIKNRIENGTQGHADEILKLAQTQLTILETKRMF